MIKQSWIISEEETIRILNMHKSATKNQYLISEQIKQTKELPPKDFSLSPQTFKSGFHSENSLDPSQKQAIETVLSQMAEYINQKKGIPMSIQIVTGESIPTNYDNENNKSLGKGELAKLRGETIKKILTNFFKGLVDKGIIPYMPQIPEPKTNIELGMKQEPYKKGVDDPKDKKYLKDQFIKFSVVASGKETTECLLGLNVRIIYIDEDKNPNFPCRGGHTCDRAEFDVYLNKTLIGVANLNNSGCNSAVKGDCNRQASLVVTQEMVNSIVNQPNFNNKLMLWYKCKSQDCHSSVPEIYIYNDKKAQLFPNSSFPSACVAPQAARGDNNSKVLMFLDGCGNPISVDQTTSAEEMRRLSDEMSAEQDAVGFAERKRQEQLSQQEKENQQKFIEDIKNKGLSFVAGKVNTNIFDSEVFQISDYSIQGNSLLVSVVPKMNYTVKYFINPYNNKLTSYSAKKDSPFKVLIPIVPIQIQQKERVFKRENSLVPVGDVGYFTLNGIPGIKNSAGIIVKPSFQ